MKHIHFIGICGVAMSALALAFHKKGWKVTGSDKGFYPPVSTHLKNAGVAYYPGWHPEKMGTPDLVVVGNVAGSKNPEWVHVQENKIPYKSYPEVVAEFFVREHSIVCAGTYGKTTTATLLSWILTQANMDPTYMFGGLSLNEMDAARITESEWSILEGDEYKSSRWDDGAKFFHYSPTHLLLSAAAWDHADVYPTEAAYLGAFEKLVKEMLETGTIIANADGPNVEQILKHAKTNLVRYGVNKNADYQYTNIAQTNAGTTFVISHTDQEYEIHTRMIGDYMAQNITGCFAMAHTIGIPSEKIIDAIASFRGVKRRLEKRLDADVTVIDDIAHSPEKARAVLKTLRNVYTGTITAVFEPNTGNRKQEAIESYKNAFIDADKVFVPRLTKVKIAKDDPSPPFDGETLADVIKKTHEQVSYIEDDDALVKDITQSTAVNDCIVFLGSHGFRGMIEAAVQKLKS